MDLTLAAGMKLIVSGGQGCLARIGDYAQLAVRMTSAGDPSGLPVDRVALEARLAGT